MEVGAEDRRILQSLEEELWRSETRFDLQRMNRLLAPDFVEFGRSGRVYQRDETLSVASQRIDAVLPLPEFRVRLLDEDTAQVTYNSAVKLDGAIEHARRSSIWSRTATGWTLRFHQGTPYQP